MTRLSRSFSLLISLAVMLTLVGAFAPVAQADPPPEAEQVHISDLNIDTNPSAKVLTGLIFQFVQNGSAPAAGTQIHVSTFSCGRFLQENTRSYDGSTNLLPIAFSPDGGLDSSPNSVNKWVSKSVEYQIDVISPGYDGYHITGSVTDYGTVDGKPLSSYRPSCDQLAGGGNTGGTSCVVMAKAKKIGQARVGHTVKVRKPKTNGACGQTSYTWKVASKTVKKGKTLSIGKGMRGKGVTVKVSLSNGPDKVVRFGHAR